MKKRKRKTANQINNKNAMEEQARHEDTSRELGENVRLLQAETCARQGDGECHQEELDIYGTEDRIDLDESCMMGIRGNRP